MNKALFVWHSAKTALIDDSSRGQKDLLKVHQKKTIRGSPTKLIATDNLLLIPPDNSYAANL